MGRHAESWIWRDIGIRTISLAKVKLGKERRALTETRHRLKKQLGKDQEKIKVSAKGS